MRLPIAKVYRGFPELDRFPDPVCEEFVRRAQREHPWAVLGLTLAIVLALVVLIPGVLMMMMGFVTFIERAWPAVRGSDAWFVGQIGIVTLGLATTTAMTLFMPRDWWLRQTITRSIMSTRCLGCRYSLLGLTVREGVVVCPECGVECSLAGRGLTPDDILAGRLSVASPPPPHDVANDRPA